MKFLVFLLGLLFPLMASQARSQGLYQWTDATGKIHIVDEIRRIPERYRHEVKTYRASPGPKKRPPTERKEVSEPASEIPGNQEQTVTASFTPEQRTARIEALREREKELEREKARLKVLETRFRTRKSRSNIYTRRMRRLDEQVEAIQKELDAIRAKGQ